VKNDFFKFPSTPHLAIYGNTEVRDDKVMSEAERTEFLQHELIVEEKVDGANLGISFDNEGNIRAQSRGSYLHIPYSGQWKKLTEWLSPRIDELFEQLTDKYVLYGEWCYAQHSIAYDSLPDWILGFDVFDKNTEKFFSYPRRNEMFNALGICQVPLIQRGHFTISELKNLVLQSKLSSHPAEGIYLRFDQGDWLEQRAKLVRPNFIQAIEKHWSRSTIKPQRLKHHKVR